MDQIKEFKNSINSEVKHIAFMPGSRRGEIKKLMPIFEQLQKELNISSTIIIPKHFTKDDIKELYGSLSGFKIAYDAT